MFNRGQQPTYKNQNDTKPRTRRLIVAILGGVIIVAAIVVVILLARPQQKNKVPSAREEFLSKQLAGNNAGFALYRAAYAGQTSIYCEAHVVYKESGSTQDIIISANDGWEEFGVTGFKVGGKEVEYLYTDDRLYFWDYDAEFYFEDDERAVGYWYAPDSPSVMSFMRKLGFRNIDTEKSKFDCESTDIYRPVLGLPNLKWEEYNVFNAN